MKEVNFWKKLNKPIFVLAPMADVTDAAFRQIITKYGKPDVIWTEFVSADGLMSLGREILQKDLRFTKKEKPIVAQLFSGNEEKMEQAARFCAELGFDGIDINMGCPDRTIERQGAGASLIKNKELAKSLIRAAKRGAPNLPISVKTRIGYNKEELDSWIPELLSEGLAALIIHARTRKEMSKVPAHWEIFKRVIEMRDRISPETLVIGNGDVRNLVEAESRARESGVDGVMIGRGIFGNPWLFARGEPTLKEKLSVMVEHTKLFEELMSGVKSFALMKKHYKAYIEGFPGARELRAKLMDCSNAHSVEMVVKSFLENN